MIPWKLLQATTDEWWWKTMLYMVDNTNNYHQSYPPGNKSISHLWKKEKSSPTQKFVFGKGYVPKRRPHHKKQDQNQYFPWWCKLSKKFPTGPWNISQKWPNPNMKGFPSQIGSHKGFQAYPPGVTRPGVQGNAAEEHRRAAEWTAKLAAENRRKLKGGGERFHHHFGPHEGF